MAALGEVATGLRPGESPRKDSSRVNGVGLRLRSDSMTPMVNRSLQEVTGRSELE